MSEARRAYDLLRGYVGREWDRLQGVERIQAEDELDRSTTSSPSAASSKPSAVPDMKDVDPKVHARRILGVSSTASLEAVRESFERLNKRSDPSKFPPDTTERTQAAQIQRRIQWAYRQLVDGVDMTELRFRSLEID